MVTPTTAVDTATGVLYDFSDHAGASSALSDGWAVSGAESGTIAPTTPGGELVEMIGRSGPPPALPVTPLNHPQPSMEELKAWETRDDLSWARVTSTPSLSAAPSPEHLPCDRAGHADHLRPRPG